MCETVLDADNSKEWFGFDLRSTIHNTTRSNGHCDRLLDEPGFWFRQKKCNSIV